MSISVQYGTYTFPVGEPELTVEESYTFSDNGALERRQSTLTISGRIQGSDQSAILAITAEMRAALQSQDQSLITKEGTSEISHLCYAGSSCCYGPKVRSLSFPESTGPELANGGRCTYRTTIEAHQELAGTDAYGTCVSFRESVTVNAGRSKYQVLETLTGTAQVWLVSGTGAYRATQEGEAVGRLTWPAAEPALWPDDRIDDNPVRYDSPTYIVVDSSGTVSHARMYRTTWSYEFASGSDVFSSGRPHQWTNQS